MALVGAFSCEIEKVRMDPKWMFVLGSRSLVPWAPEVIFTRLPPDLSLNLAKKITSGTQGSSLAP